MVSQFSSVVGYSATEGFRPLSGFMVSQSVLQIALQRGGEFPSPFGVYGFSMFLTLSTPISALVSVPFRGLWFLNKRRAILRGENPWFPSPFGVYGFSIAITSAVCACRGLFPSPFGVYGFSIMFRGRHSGQAVLSLSLIHI